MGKRAHFPEHEHEHEHERERRRECGPEQERGCEHGLGHNQDVSVAALLRERLRDAARDRKEHLATFSRYYESRDRKLCVFEDEHGHFTSVRADRLA